MSYVNMKRVARILEDAIALGDEVAAKKWKISSKTIERYRKRADTDPSLSAVVRENHMRIEKTLAQLRVDYMRDAIECMRTKWQEATLYEVAGSIKIVGELHQVAVAVAEEDDDERPTRADSKAAEDAGSFSSANAPH